MGYTTNFEGSFKLDRPLAPEHLAYLKAFANSRRMARIAKTANDKLTDPVRLAAGLPIGPEGAYYVGSAAVDHGQSHDVSIKNYNDPPVGQPGLWCQWVPNADGTQIVWDGGEKFYYYVEWLEYVVSRFLSPWGYKLNGEVTWEGEDGSDRGMILAKDNVVSRKRAKVSVTYDD
jgi:hypothetical protein